MKKSDHQLVQQVIDGALPREGFDGFQERMRAEPELVTLYQQYSSLHHSLCEEHEGQRWVDPRPLLPERRFGVCRIGLMMVFVVGLVAGLVWFGTRGRPGLPRPLAGATFSADAQWEIGGFSRGSAGLTDLGVGSTLRLLRGEAKLEMRESGAIAVLQSPATVTLLSDASMHMANGSGWFRMQRPGGRLSITTPFLTVEDLGTEFGVVAYPERAGELHVIEGKVRLTVNRSQASQLLVQGEGARVDAEGQVEKVGFDGMKFRKQFPKFETVLQGPPRRDEWRVSYGAPDFSGMGLVGENYSAFRKVEVPEPVDGKGVILVTLETGAAGGREFHTDGWAGISFFSGGSEVLFFGDSFGARKTWSLDVKQRIPVIVPAEPLLGPRTVTLRYEAETGEVSLHDGGLPLGREFCRGTLPAGTRFDEIRLGASAGAALDVRSLALRIGRGF